MTTSIASNDQAKNVPKKLKQDQELINPCYKESLISAQCLERNQYDYTLCEVQFENYRVCKRFWSSVISKRRLEGVMPIVPPPDEREKIRKEFINTLHH
ncbi:coiled-coil-helix-coiled-coil-helix domain-containing protein 7 [Ceratina calcarata]|uniref:Coiled-coil-helix-coiled-coil-helix domain-containing protein 7 n=1 Tax=Ceratina calcarata TaxID=156304 RepID=A0AAJ7S2N5_9HYME|nr:coiled-coil-helix-coiled-coil-helix domain-containing protein 7 [Ceratina calcarata]XP_026670227.1 coiled-coil-helix-coiled-coil-helix domain-containing protein 7 [Ceratina calcarata]